MKRGLYGYLAIGTITAVIAAASHFHSDRAEALLKIEYRTKSSAEASDGARNVDQAFDLIYQNLRTLASLPGIRSIDRHGANLSTEARTTFQMIYNNLASSVSVSEVYVVPANFNPQRVDPATGAAEEPIIMFDELILNAGSGISTEQRALDPESVREALATGPAEIEIHEFHQLAEHAAWFRERYPLSKNVPGLRVPIISGEEVITRDNTQFIHSGNDADRRGIIFSVPFFDAGGKFAGMVSAIILTDALRDLLPAPDYALVNPGNGFVSIKPGAGAHVVQARDAISRGERDTKLIFSQVIALSTEDPRSAWGVWAGFDNDRYYSSPDYVSLRKLRFGGYGIALILLIAASLSWFFINRDMARNRLAEQRLRDARDDALRAEAEASSIATKLQTVNEEIARLNRELSDKVLQLHAAQDEIVRRGRMSQLGQLTATIAHELRNPMGAVRNTAFLIRRKIKGSGLDLEQQLARIDKGISRCDDIISQLLDFARSKRPDFVEIDLDSWLADCIGEETRTLPETIEVECHLGLSGQPVSFDPDRMRRVLANLVHNAAEAMTGRPGAPPGTPCPHPKILVETRISAHRVEISIRDNGPGMTADILARVKEPLFTTKNFGTGLGLPAVERILELHGGGLDIRSEPGAGATFTAWFPMQQPAAVQAA